MACYAAVLSLFHTLNNIKIHPRPPISLDQKQVESLTQNLTFFQHFLELHPTYEDDDLESRIIAASCAAEDLIETHIVHQIDRARSTSDHGEDIRPVDLNGGLERVIQDMDLIKTEVMQIKKQKIMTPPHRTNSSGGPAAASTWQSSIIMPMFDDAMIIQVLDKLTGEQSSLQIISIVGMGGIGKTTFAKSIYTNPLIVQRFDTLAWVTISQDYSRANILQVLCQEIKGRIDGLSEMSEVEIGLILYKHLWGRRYFIVMDDIWSVDAWYKVKSFFPDNNESRIMITTRLSNLALELSGFHIFQMQFLDEDMSWDLLCGIVFGELDCPIELENIGKEIAKKCRGLPLSIAVIGGLLRKSNMSQAYWIHTFENLNLLINLEDDECTLRIMRTSYKELPMHLKPCFLYMGIFPEDDEIRMSKLIKLWVAEGILRPSHDKSLEEVAKEYLKELTDRNLILIPEVRWDGEAKLCKIHDLLRDVCLRETQKQKFFSVLRKQIHHTPQGANVERRKSVDSENTDEEYSPQFRHVVESASLARSLSFRRHGHGDMIKALSSLRSILLKVRSSVDDFNSIVTDSNNATFEQTNLRYLTLKLDFRDAAAPGLLSLCSPLWSLQTIEVDSRFSSKPIIASEIWEMPLLRHVKVNRFTLPDPPNGEEDFVLENLQTLSTVLNFKFSEAVVKRIPNIRKLKVLYDSTGVDEEEGSPNFCLSNVGHLQKLESFNLITVFTDCRDLENIRNSVSFPHSIKRLTLYGTKLIWEDLKLRIGPLPLLQVLRLSMNACRGPKWETVEGQFCSLRVLQISCGEDLKYWNTDSSHFPRLVHLFLEYFRELEEIPVSIGDIPTLKSIRVKYCNTSSTDSAKKIKEEQEENGNEDLQVIIVF